MNSLSFLALATSHTRGVLEYYKVCVEMLLYTTSGRSPVRTLQACASGSDSKSPSSASCLVASYCHSQRKKLYGMYTLLFIRVHRGRILVRSLFPELRFEVHKCLYNILWDLFPWWCLPSWTYCSRFNLIHSVSDQSIIAKLLSKYVMMVVILFGFCYEKKSFIKRIIKCVFFV